jgi:hypothetical protein
MGDLRKMIIKGIREFVSWSQNIAKAFDVQQGKDEGTSRLSSQTKDQMRKYSVLNLNDTMGQEKLKLHFVTNS